MVQTLIHAHGHIFALRTFSAEYFLKTSDCFRQISAQGASIRIWLISIPLFKKNVIKTWCYFMLTLQKCANLIIDEVLGLVHNITEKWPTFWSLYSNVNADAYKWFVIFIILKKKNVRDDQYSFIWEYLLFRGRNSRDSNNCQWNKLSKWWSNYQYPYRSTWALISCRLIIALLQGSQLSWSVP